MQLGIPVDRGCFGESARAADDNASDAELEDKHENANVSHPLGGSLGMSFVFKFTAGYSLPALLLLILLVDSHNANEWSGNSPLNSWPAIPFFYLAYLAVSSVVIAILHKSPSNYALLSGFIGGMPQLMVARQTAALFQGWTSIMAVTVGAATCVAIVTWVGALRSHAGDPPPNDQG